MTNHSNRGKRRAKAGEFTNFDFRKYEDGTCAVFSKTGKFYALFANIFAADKAVTAAQMRAAIYRKDHAK